MAKKETRVSELDTLRKEEKRLTNVLDLTKKGLPHVKGQRKKRYERDILHFTEKLKVIQQKIAKEQQ